MPAHRGADLQRALHRLLQIAPKDERDAVTCRQPDQISVFGCTHRIGVAHNPFQRLEQIALFVDQPFGVADEVDEKDVADLGLKV